MSLAASKVVPAALILLIAGCVPALSQSERDICRDREAKYTADQRISACSSLIASGRLIEKNLAAAYGNRGNAWQDKGEFDRAMADYDRVSQISPNNDVAYNTRGNIWNKKGNIDRAIAEYDIAIQLNPSNEHAFMNRGTAWQAKGSFNRAIADYDKAIQINTSFALAFYNRGTVFEAKGELARAMADYDKVIQINPNDASAYNARCWLRATSGRDLPQALDDCGNALRIEPGDANILDSRALVHLKLGTPDKAIADYTASLSAKANSASALYGRGIARRRSGDKAGGDADVSRAQALQADIAQVYAGYGVK